MYSDEHRGDAVVAGAGARGARSRHRSRGGPGGGVAAEEQRFSLVNRGGGGQKDESLLFRT